MCRAIERAEVQVFGLVRRMCSSAAILVSLACHTRLAARGTRFCLYNDIVGITNDALADYYLARIRAQGVTKRHLLYLLRSRHVFGVSIALRLGIVDEVIQLPAL